MESKKEGFIVLFGLAVVILLIWGSRALMDDQKEIETLSVDIGQPDLPALTEIEQANREITFSVLAISVQDHAAVIQKTDQSLH